MTVRNPIHSQSQNPFLDDDDDDKVSFFSADEILKPKTFHSFQRFQRSNIPLRTSSGSLFIDRSTLTFSPHAVYYNLALLPVTSTLSPRPRFHQTASTRTTLKFGRRAMQIKIMQINASLECKFNASFWMHINASFQSTISFSLCRKVTRSQSSSRIKTARLSS